MFVVTHKRHYSVKDDKDAKETRTQSHANHISRGLHCLPNVNASSMSENRTESKSFSMNITI